MLEQRTARLELRDVGAGYPGTFRLSGVTFTATAGDVVGLIGPNGSGKSTLLKAIAGVIPLQDGSVTFAGRPLREQAPRVAFVPQREDVNWEFPVSARDVVLMGRYRRTGWFRPPRSADREAARAALLRMGLAGLENRHISAFSGGQQHRIFLARALAQEPVVVLLDEPFTGVDVHNRTVLEEAIADFGREGAVVIVATHDLDEVTKMCTHLACLNGRLVAYGPVQEAFTPENLRATYGGQVAVFA